MIRDETYKTSQSHSCLHQKSSSFRGNNSRPANHGCVVTDLGASLLDFVAAYHQREPLKLGISRSGLASGWGKLLTPKLFHFIVERQLRAGKLATEQDVLRLATHKVSLASDQAKLRQTLLDAYEKGGLTPPNVKDILEPLELTFKEAQPVYKVLIDEGRLVKAQENMYFCAAAIKGLIEKVQAYFAAGATDMGPTEFRELTGLSRKFLIALLEYLDKEKITVRVGDKRQLRRR